MVKVVFGKINYKDKIYRPPQTLSMPSELEDNYIKAGIAEQIAHNETESPKNEIMAELVPKKKGRR